MTVSPARRPFSPFFLFLVVCSLLAFLAPVKAQETQNPATPSGLSQDQDNVTAAELSELRAADMGLLGAGNGGFANNLWAVSDGKLIIASLPYLSRAHFSPTTARLARRLLLSTAAAPEVNLSTFLALRASVLYALGATEGVRMLAEQAGGIEKSETLQSMHVMALLAERQSEAACKVQSYISPAGYNANVAGIDAAASLTARLQAFCAALAKDEAGANLAIDLAREMHVEDDAFYDLITRLNAPAATDTAQAPIISGKSFSALHDALYRAIGLALPDDVALRAEAALLPALVHDTTLPLKIRVEAAERGFDLALVTSADVVALYAQFPDTQQSFQSLSGMEARAAAFRLARDASPEARGPILEAALMAAAQTGHLPLMASVLAPLAPSPSPAPLVPAMPGENAPVAPAVPAVPAVNEKAASYLALGLLAAGAVDQAIAYRTLMPAGSNSRPQQIIDIFLTLARPSQAQILSPLLSQANIGHDASLLVWQVRAAQLQDGLAVSGSYALTKGLAAAVLASEMGVFDKKPTPHAVVLSALERAAAHGRVGEGVLLSLVTLGEQGPAASADLTVQTAVQALTTLGVQTEARRIAIEALLPGALALMR